LLGSGVNPGRPEENSDSFFRRFHKSRIWRGQYHLGKASFSSRCSGGIEALTPELATLGRYALRERAQRLAEEHEIENRRVHGRELQLSEQENNSAIKVAKGVRETVNQDGAVLLDIEQGLCFSLNPIGTRIWEMVKDGRSIAEITDALQQEYRLPRSQLVGDVSDFLKQLEEMQLIGEQSSSADKHGFLSRLFGRSRSA
jgi:hypothetical protein